MVIQRSIICIALMLVIGFSSTLHGQEKKFDKLRVGGGSASATQRSLWLAKEGGSEKTPDPFSPPR